MGDHSAIEWTDSTWNPVTGCTKISPGCKFCYAERITERWGRADFRTITLHPDRLPLPLRWRAPRRIFVNSMSDLFHEKVPIDFIEDVFDVMERANHHVFQVLTKRVDRLLQWHRDSGRKIPAHVWVGVSVESAPYLWRVDRLREVEAQIRFVSAEPLLGRLAGIDLKDISWVITGGESGGPPHRSLVARTTTGWRPKPEALMWVRELRDLCLEQGIVFPQTMGWAHAESWRPAPRSAGLETKTKPGGNRHAHSPL